MKVLLVDDEIFTIRMLQNVIHWEELGLTVVGYAQTGEEAVEKVVREQPNIIISDIRMPGMDGLDFLKLVHDISPEIKTILMSAYAEFSYVQKGMKLGCSDYILKPVDEKELENALRKIVAEILGKKEKERVITKSEKQLDGLKLYQYMKSGSGKNRVLKSVIGDKIQSCRVLIARIDSATIDEYDASANMELGHEGYITNLLEQTLSRQLQEYFVFDYEEGCWLIVLSNTEKVSCVELAESMISKLMEKIGIQLVICFSTQGEGLESLPGLYEEVQYLNKYSFYAGEGNVFGYGYNCDKKEFDELKEIDLSKEKEQAVKDKNYSRPIKESIHYIEENYAKNISMEEICNEIAVSKNYFCYLFKRETGISVWNYLTMLRLQQAKKLLEETRMKSYEIAFAVGYDNPSYFSKLFKKHENMTPNEYRDERQNV